MADKEEDESLIPIVLGIGIGAIALVLSGKGSKATPGTITLQWVSNCPIATPGMAEVVLAWVSTTQDTSYNILQNGLVVGTVTGTQWTSPLIPASGQNQTVSYIVQGVQSGIISNSASVLVANCQSGGPPPSNVLSVVATFT